MSFKEICESEQLHEEYFITDYECEYMEVSEYFLRKLPILTPRLTVKMYSK